MEEPAIQSGSVDVVATASYYVGASSSPNEQDPQAFWSANEVVDDAGGVSPTYDRDDDSTVYCTESFYFGLAPSPSQSRQYGTLLMNRHDIASRRTNHG